MDMNTVIRYFLIRMLGSVIFGAAMGDNITAFIYFLFLWLVSDVLMFAIRQLNKPNWR